MCGIGVFGLTILIVALVAVVAAFILPLVSLLTGVSYGARPEASAVSGFYGPGAFFAWLLSAGYTTFTYLADGSQASKTTPVVKPDIAAFIALLAGAAFAAGDSLIRLSHGSRIGSDAQLDAALVVCRYAVLYAALALLARSERCRGLWHWRVLLLVATMPIVVAEALLCSAPLHQYRLLIPLGALAYSFVRVWSYRLFWCFFVYLAAFVWVEVSLKSPSGGDEWNLICRDAEGSQRPWYVSAPWPVSAAAWSDLDQMAAIGGAGIALLYLLGKRSERVMHWTGRARLEELLQRQAIHLGVQHDLETGEESAIPPPKPSIAPLPL